MRIFERLRQNLCRHTMGPERLSAEPARGGLFAWRVSQHCTKCGAESWREAQPHEVPVGKIVVKGGGGRSGPVVARGAVRIAE